MNINGQESVRRWPAEWERQDGILLAWPHAGTDWADTLAEAQAVYLQIMRKVSDYERVVLAVPSLCEGRAVLERLGPVRFPLTTVVAEYNDTWLRDSGPLAIVLDNKPRLIDFRFNGWGGKFSAAKDDCLAAALYQSGIFRPLVFETSDFVFEGGSLETNGCGTLMTTAGCLEHPTRNPGKSRRELENELSQRLGIENFIWLEHGMLEGDDTDGHIDMLARFAPGGRIAYVAGCGAGRQAKELMAMRRQLEKLRTPDGAYYQLEKLPFPPVCHDSEGAILPQSYANYLVINGAVLVPQYGVATDAEALMRVGRLFPERKVIGIDCSALISQHGAIHCISMQIPEGCLI